MIPVLPIFSVVEVQDEVGCNFIEDVEVQLSTAQCNTQMENWMLLKILHLSPKFLYLIHFYNICTSIISAVCGFQVSNDLLQPISYMRGIFWEGTFLGKTSQCTPPTW